MLVKVLVAVLENELVAVLETELLAVLEAVLVKVTKQGFIDRGLSRQCCVLKVPHNWGQNKASAMICHQLTQHQFNHRTCHHTDFLAWFPMLIANKDDLLEPSCLNRPRHKELLPNQGRFEELDIATTDDRKIGRRELSCRFQRETLQNFSCCTVIALFHHG